MSDQLFQLISRMKSSSFTKFIFLKQIHLHQVCYFNGQNITNQSLFFFHCFFDNFLFFFLNIQGLKHDKKNVLKGNIKIKNNKCIIQNLRNMIDFFRIFCKNNCICIVILTFLFYNKFKLYFIYIQNQFIVKTLYIIYERVNINKNRY